MSSKVIEIATNILIIIVKYSGFSNLNLAAATECSVFMVNTLYLSLALHGFVKTQSQLPLEA